jgi:hypothetical protein
MFEQLGRSSGILRKIRKIFGNSPGARQLGWRPGHGPASRVLPHERHLAFVSRGSIGWCVVVVMA